jgi:hypothetical protein
MIERKKADGLSFSIGRLSALRSIAANCRVHGYDGYFWAPVYFFSEQQIVMRQTILKGRLNGQF